eukprot:gene29052-32254_t
MAPTPNYSDIATTFCSALLPPTPPSLPIRDSLRGQLKAPAGFVTLDNGFDCPLPGTAESTKATYGAYQLAMNPETGNSSTGIVATHCVLIPGTHKVLLFSRQINTDLSPTEPGMANSVSSVYDPYAGTYVPTPMPEHPFCAGHSHLRDGTIIVTGGEEPGGAKYSWLKEGRKSIRTFNPSTLQWTTLPQLLNSNHWYPTQLTLPDGRVIVAGGSKTQTGPPNSETEIIDTRTSPYTVSYQVLDLPRLPNSLWIAAMSSMASALMMPFRPDGNGGYTISYAMFGGSTSRNQAYIDPDGNYVRLDWGCNGLIPALDKSLRLTLDAKKVMAGDTSGMAFEQEDMPVKRIQHAAILLPNGQVLLINGNQYGRGGGGLNGGASDNTAAKNAVLYDPMAPKGARYSCLAASNIKRFYHNAALLLPTGDVLVSGSEQDEPGNQMCQPPGAYLPQFQAEIFKLPYAFAVRPAIVSAPTGNIVLGDLFQVEYKGSVNGATLAAPGAFTHSTDMGQRVVFLRVVSNVFNAVQGTGSLVLQAPCASSLVANPGTWMLFLLDGTIPCVNASWVKLTVPATDANRIVSTHTVRAGLAHRSSRALLGTDAVCDSSLGNPSRLADPNTCGSFLFCCDGRAYPVVCAGCDPVSDSDAGRDPRIGCRLDVTPPIKGSLRRELVAPAGFVTLDNGFDCPLPGTTESTKTMYGAYQLAVNPETGTSSTGIVATHCVLIPGTHKVLLFSRQINTDRFPTEPGMATSVSSVYDPYAGTYVPMPMPENPFCAGHTHLRDGTIIVAGGDETPNSWLKEGRKSIRIFNPSTLQWTTLPQQLHSEHWYPAQLTLPDGRVLVAGGYRNGNGAPPNPETEIIDTRTTPYTVTYKVDDFLVQAGYSNLYPVYLPLPINNPAKPGTYYLLQWDNWFGKISTIAPDNSQAQVLDLPGLPNTNWNAAMSSMASALMLPFRPDSNGGYTISYAMFGGSTAGNNVWIDPATGYPVQLGEANHAAAFKCERSMVPSFTDIAAVFCSALLPATPPTPPSPPIRDSLRRQLVAPAGFVTLDNGFDCPLPGTTESTKATFGAYQLAVNPETGNSSTGIVATHNVLIPGTH